MSSKTNHNFPSRKINRPIFPKRRKKRENNMQIQFLQEFNRKKNYLSQKGTF